MVCPTWSADCNKAVFNVMKFERKVTKFSELNFN